MTMTPEERAHKLYNSGCNCGGTDIGVGIMHEPGCGYPHPEEVEGAIRAAEAGAYRRGLGDAAEVAESKGETFRPDGIRKGTLKSLLIACRGVLVETALEIRALADRDTPDAS